MRLSAQSLRKSACGTPAEDGARTDPPTGQRCPGVRQALFHPMIHVNVLMDAAFTRTTLCAGSGGTIARVSICAMLLSERCHKQGALFQLSNFMCIKI